ncbi:hypothetical protein [Amycolatopsis thermophila]|uniref:Integral membrane protein n=1 Tax=Amycolatopsis thermophila TaxID=206084 RepID=A0ABU0EX61_9PSEU|nr:hypothetical protein [Amycolatopsis thermophila]MDQ0379856.1 hypothetical protein [Amycolatopsis thermophila]
MVGVRLAAGLLIALAVGAQAGGWWLLGGAVVAALLAWSAPEPPGLAPNPARLLASARLVSRLTLVPVCAAAFAAYLFPRQPLAGAAVALVVTAADAAGLRLARYARAWLLGILLVAGAGFVVLCFAIDPAQPVTAPEGTIGGLFASAAVVFPLLPRGKPAWLAGSAAAVLAVGAGALYQLGPVRLALSGVPVRDALAALDGQVLDPLLGGVVVLSTVPAALLAMRETRAELAWPRASVACGLVAAVVAVVLDPDQALLLAAAAALAEVLVTAVLSMIAGITVRAVIAAVLAVTLLAWLPPLYLLGTVVAVAAGAALTRRSGTPAA